MIGLHYRPDQVFVFVANYVVKLSTKNTFTSKVFWFTQKTLEVKNNE